MLFDRSALFKSQIIDFYTKADVGPLVIGEWITTSAEDYLIKNLRSLDAPLNIVLYFTQPTLNGMNNPLYGIANDTILKGLFSLYAYYNKLIVPNGRGRLKVNNEMRDLIQLAIQKDIQQIKEDYIGDSYVENQLHNTQNYLMSAYHQASPNNNVIYDITGFEAGKLFNPANFIYGNFNDIIKASKVDILTQKELDQLTPEITQAYKFLFPEADLISADMVLEYQEDMIELAHAYVRRK